MGFNLKEHLIGGKTFCCCFPTRAGVIVMSFLTMIVSLLLAIIIWFEVSTSKTMYIYEKRAFVLAGIVETILCITSALGFAGTIAKKLVFVRIYAYFLYFHFLLNIAIASYFLWMIHHATHTDVVAACERIANAQAHDQCTGLLKIATNVFVGVAAALLLIELYGAIIVTRYMRQLKFEKIQDKTIRTSRLASLHEQQMSRRMAQATDSEDIALLNASSKPTPAAEGDGFNPYENLGYRDEPDNHGLQEIPQADVENGYGGGTWRFEDIHAEAKEHESAPGHTLHDQDTRGPGSPTYTHRQPDTSAHADVPPAFSSTITPPPHPHS